MLRKFNNHPPENNDSAERKPSKGFGFHLTAVLILGIILLVGGGIFFTHEPLQKIYTHISTVANTSFKRFFRHEPTGPSLFQALKNLWPDSKGSEISQPVPPESNNVPENFLYTLELTDGGKIEGTVIKVGEKIITVTDEKGLEIKINKSRVTRISKIPL